MTVSALSAARTLCEIRDWSLSNLEIQKILYLAHMFHLGRSGQPLVRETFEAWDYGPVIPEVYARAKGYGSGSVKPSVFGWYPAVPVGSPEYKILEEAAVGLRGVRPGHLVDLTHRKGGAWANHYRVGMRGIKIPNDDIAREYQAHVAANDTGKSTV